MLRMALARFALMKTSLCKLQRHCSPLSPRAFVIESSSRSLTIRIRCRASSEPMESIRSRRGLHSVPFAVAMDDGRRLVFRIRHAGFMIPPSAVDFRNHRDQRRRASGWGWSRSSGSNSATSSSRLSEYRSRRSCTQTNGSTWFAFALAMMLYRIAAAFPPLSLPRHIQFFRPIAQGRTIRSLRLSSIDSVPVSGCRALHSLTAV